MRNLFILFLAIVGLQCFGQNEFYSKPWENEKYPIVIDAYEKNSIDMNKLIADDKTKAIFHRASIGFRTDTKFLERRNEAKKNNILYASYHLGTNEDPIKQADFYLQIVGLNSNEPMALDIEDIGGNNITLKDAEKFIQRIYEKTNRYPFVYVNNKVYLEINKSFNNKSLFAKCPLWYARFRSSINDISFNVWDKVTMWQFSCELNCKKTGECLYNVPGTKYDMDINSFNGTDAELYLLWSSTTTSDFELQGFIKNNMKSHTRNKIEYIGNYCNDFKTYFVQVYNADGEIKDRAIIYTKQNSIKISRKFIFWVAENYFISFTHKSADIETDQEIEQLEITYNLGKFSVSNLEIVNSKEPEKELTGRRNFMFNEFIDENNDCN